MVNEIKTFSCGLCNKFTGTRKGLRKHLREEHLIYRKLTNVAYELKKGYIKQNWWNDKFFA
jgi:hypothetical protein